MNKKQIIERLKEIESSGGNVDESTPIEEVTCQHDDFEWCYLQGLLAGLNNNTLNADLTHQEEKQ